jgi:YggT family protein
MININPFINLIASVLSIYSFLLLLYVIFHFLFLFKVVNPHNQFILLINRFLHRVIEPVLVKLRRYIPPISGFDVSVLILFLMIGFVKDMLYTYFYV